MEKIIVSCCRNCPHYDGSDHDFAICGHSDAPKGGYYTKIVSRSHFKPEPIPKWCPMIPLENLNYITKRDSNDQVISRKKIILTAKVKNA